MCVWVASACSERERVWESESAREREREREKGLAASCEGEQK